MGTLCVSGSGAQLCYSLEGTPIQILTIHPSQQIDSPDLVLLLIEVCADKIEPFCSSLAIGQRENPQSFVRFANAS